MELLYRRIQRSQLGLELGVRTVGVVTVDKPRRSGGVAKVERPRPPAVFRSRSRPAVIVSYSRFSFVGDGPGLAEPTSGKILRATGEIAGAERKGVS